jgi:hypothetical protein
MMINKYKKIARMALLILLVISMLGPWMFDLINVPAQFTCDKPFVRLYGDFCGLPLSGFQYVGLSVGGFFQMLIFLMNGGFIDQPRELLFVGSLLLILLPFFTTLLSLWKKETRLLPTINLIAWILALLPSLLMFVLLAVQRSEYIFRLWGLWLYILVAISAVIIESFVMKNRERVAVNGEA